MPKKVSIPFEAFNFTSNGPSDIVFDPPLALTGGTTYTWRISSDKMCIVGTLTDTYAHGRSNFSASSDYYFQTYLTSQTPVTLSVTDPAGNVGQCVGLVTVFDTVPPVANCLDTVTVNLEAGGFVNVDGSLFDNSSFDLCGITSFTAVPSFFTCNEQ